MHAKANHLSMYELEGWLWGVLGELSQKINISSNEVKAMDIEDFEVLCMHAFVEDWAIFCFHWCG